jgi:hypothetical protein
MFFSAKMQRFEPTPSELRPACIRMRDFSRERKGGFIWTSINFVVCILYRNDHTEHNSMDKMKTSKNEVGESPLPCLAPSMRV